MTDDGEEKQRRGLARPGNLRVYPTRPTVGRVVHYNTTEITEPYAAVITGVYDDVSVVDLVVFHRPAMGGISTAKVSAHSMVRRGTGPGEWSWPVLV